MNKNVGDLFQAGRSEEAQEIMGQVPPWIERWSITAIALVLCMLIAGCFFFNYPDTLSADITITTASPPIEVYARNSGVLSILNARNGENVERGEVIAVMDNAADLQSVEKVGRLLNFWKHGKIGDRQLASFLADKALNLGDIQPMVTSFVIALQQHFRTSHDNYYREKISMREGLEALRRQDDADRDNLISLHRRQAVVKERIYKRDSILFGQKARTGTEMDLAELSYLQGLQTAFTDKSDQRQSQMLQLSDKEAIEDLQHQYSEQVYQTGNTLQSSVAQLSSALDNWDKTFVVRAPISGKLNLMGSLAKRQTVNAGDLLLIVIPRSPTRSVGRAKVPAAGSGKMKTGNAVRVRVNNYPDREFGYVMGQVGYISAVPDSKGMYYLEIVFPKGLETNYGRRLPQSRQMTGSAEIVVDNRKLIEKFVEPLAKIMK